jgi:hypothetical protein
MHNKMMDVIKKEIFAQMHSSKSSYSAIRGDRIDEMVGAFVI